MGEAGVTIGSVGSRQQPGVEKVVQDDVSRVTTDCLELLYQRVPQFCRWALADEAVLQAIGRREPVKRGPRGVVLERMVKWASVVNLASVVVGVVGTYVVAKLCIEQLLQGWRTRGEATLGHERRGETVHVFVGFGARAEESLFNAYRSDKRDRVLRVDQTNLGVTGGAARPGPGQLLRCMVGAINEVRVALASLPVELRGRRVAFTTSAAMRLGAYAFARAWWRDLLTHYEVREATFLAADSNAFAAIAEGVRSQYLQHGLLTRHLLLPEFDEVRTLTMYEQRYVREKLPRAAVHATREMRPVAARHKPRLLVASGNRSVDDMMLVVPLLRFAKELGLGVHVRLFRGEEASRFWASRQREDGFHLDKSDGSFDDLLEELQPAFVASWGSTALADALYKGIVPICVAASGDQLVSETVYPLFRCCLRWPEHELAIRDAVASPAAYSATLQRLQTEETAEGPSEGRVP
mgnify:CR=1 FL=1